MKDNKNSHYLKNQSISSVRHDYSPRKKHYNNSKEDKFQEYVRLISNERQLDKNKFHQESIKDLNVIYVTLNNKKEKSQIRDQLLKKMNKQYLDEIKQKYPRKQMQNQSFKLKEKWDQFHKKIQQHQVTVQFPQINRVKQSLVIEGPSMHLKPSLRYMQSSLSTQNIDLNEKIKIKKKHTNHSSIVQKSKKIKYLQKQPSSSFPVIKISESIIKQANQQKKQQISRWTINGFN